jgi:hypothetical protein
VRVFGVIFLLVVQRWTLPLICEIGAIWGLLIALARHGVGLLSVG